MLEAAYNDSQGVTAAFNRNALLNINTLLGADFVSEQFRHEARYDAAQGCIQMFLISSVDQRVSLGGQTFAFAAGEAVHTENSYKYDVAEFLALAATAGFTEDYHWSDEKGWFTVYLLTAA